MTYTPSSDKAGIRHTIRVLTADGWTLTEVQSPGDDPEPVKGEADALALITDLDDAFLVVERGDEVGWVRFVQGNDPIEVVCDYTVNLTAVVEDQRTWREE